MVLICIYDLPKNGHFQTETAWSKAHSYCSFKVNEFRSRKSDADIHLYQEITNNMTAHF